MTTTEGSFNPGRRRPLHALTMWWGHYSASWLPAIYAAASVLIVVKWWGVDLPATVEALRALLTVAIIAGLLTERIHDRNLCLRHIQEAPVLDPQSAVDKHRGLLKFPHRPKRVQWAAVGLAAMPLLLPATRVLDLPLYAKIALTGVAAVGLAATWYFLHAFAVHRRLKPWCPWCDHGKGRDHPTVAPSPDPVGTAKH